MQAQQQSQSQIPPLVEAFQRRWKVSFRSQTGGYYLRGQTGLISTLHGRFYFSAVWVDRHFISQLRQLHFTQIQEGRLREWFFPDDAYTTLAEDATAVSLAFQIIGKPASLKTRKALLKAIQSI